MPLVPLTTPITLANLRNAFDGMTTTLTENKRLGAKDNEPSMRLASLATGLHVLARSIAWTQQSDQELRTIFLRVTDSGGAARAVSATLTVDDANEDTEDNSRYLLDLVLTASTTTIAGTVQTSLDVRTTTGQRVRLLSGVRYRLEIGNTSGGTITGPLEAGVQRRNVRRGGAGGPALVPYGFRARANVDVDKVNGNLLAIAGDIEDSQDARFTYGTAIFDLSGVVDTAAAVLREFAIRRPGASNALDVFAVELVIASGTTAVVWSLTKTGDTMWPTVSVTAAGADVEAHAMSNIPAAVPVADLVFALAASTAAGNTIDRGYLVIHTRADRWNQGSTLTRYVPAQFGSRTSTAMATLQAELDAIAARVGEDTAADVDLRCECFAVRSLASGSAVTFRLPSGARELLGTVGYLVGGAGCVATITVTGTGLAGSSLVLNGTGVAARVAGTDAASGTMNDDPTDSADDATVTITISGGVTALLCYVLVFWQ